MPFHPVIALQNAQRTPGADLHAEKGPPDRDARLSLPRQQDRGLELNFVGTFKSVWAGKRDEELLKAARAGNWSPDSNDMIAFAKKGRSRGPTTNVVNLSDLLYKVGKNKPRTIGRLNLFTHATKGSISLSGEVTSDNVYWDEDKEALGDEAMEDAEKQTFGLEGMTEKRIFDENITIENVREAFRKDAVVVVYGCHSGLDKPYLNKIARLFGVKVKAFSKEIRYTLVPDRSGKHISKRTYGLKDSSINVRDSHDLVPDVESD